jgi:hypothetical protein
MCKCESYKPDKVDGCTHLDIKTYSVGISRYCKWFGVDIYEIEDCPLRPKYSGESQRKVKE